MTGNSCLRADSHSVKALQFSTRLMKIHNKWLGGQHMKSSNVTKFSSTLVAAVMLFSLFPGAANASSDSTDGKIPGITVKSDFDFDRPVFQDKKLQDSLSADQLADPDAKAIEVQPMAGCGGTTSYALAGAAWYLSSDGCSHIGLTDTAQRYYSWQKGQFAPANACVRARGYQYNGAVVWISAGCGTSGVTAVPWGRVASVSKVQVSSMSLVAGTNVIWY